MFLSRIAKNPEFIKPKKMVLIMPEYIGDAVLLTSVIKNLRLNFGERCIIDVVTGTKTINLLEGMPYIDNLYADKLQITNKIAFLKKNQYDTAFMLTFSLSWPCAAYLARTKQRVGFNLVRLGIDMYFKHPQIFTHNIRLSSIQDKKSQLDIYLNVLKDLKLPVYNKSPEIFINKLSIEKADNLIKDQRTLKFVIHVTAGSLGKLWPMDYWEVVIKYLKTNFKCEIFALGSYNDKFLYDKLSKNTGVPINNLCGHTSIKESIAFYRLMDLIITTDSGPAHLAGVAGAKNIIVIYGPTNNFQWQPYAPNSNVQQVYLTMSCRPCLKRFCTNKICLTELKPQLVINAVNKLFANILT